MPGVMDSLGRLRTEALDCAVFHSLCQVTQNIPSVNTGFPLLAVQLLVHLYIIKIVRRRAVVQTQAPHAAERTCRNTEGMWWGCCKATSAIFYAASRSV